MKIFCLLSKNQFFFISCAEELSDRQDALKKIAACGPCILLLHHDFLDSDFIEAVKSKNPECFVVLFFSGKSEVALSYCFQNLIDGIYFHSPAKNQESSHNKFLTSDLLVDVFSGEYINDLIYGHPERLDELRPLLKLMQLDINPHIVLTIVLDHFWTVCEKKDNAYRYRLKRSLLNNIRKTMRGNMQGVASTLIGTDKVVVLLDCQTRTASDSITYADECAAKIQENVQKRLDLSVSVGVSKYCGTPAFVWRAYEQSFRALESSFQMGNGQILHYRPPVSSLSGELEKTDQEQIKRDLIIAISNQDRESCFDALNALTSKLALQNAGESYIKSFLVITLSEIARYCIAMGLDSSEISEKIIAIINDIFKSDTMNDVKKVIMRFLDDLLCKIKSSSSDISALGIAKAYINQYYMDSLSQNEVAGLCGYSTAHFSRSFKENFGINFVQYLMQIRLDNAKKLLAESDLSATEVCEKTGFQSLSYFSTAFKKECGMTPQQYRIENTKIRKPEITD